VIDERTDRHQLRELDDAAVVVAVEVGDELVVDARYAGVASCGENPLGIARSCGIARLRPKRAVARKPGVNEQRLARGGDDEGRLPTLDVYKVDRESLRGGADQDGGRGQDKSGPSHRALHSKFAASSGCRCPCKRPRADRHTAGACDRDAAGRVRREHPHR